jgi:asparagine synthase (glutamine-hydrolysing)
VLSGAGGDEIFGGYPWRYYRSVGHKDFDAYIDDYYHYWHRLLPNSSLKKLFTPVWDEVKDIWTRDLFRDVYRSHKNELTCPEDYINHSLYFEAKTFLHGLLVVEDKLSMAHSLESRVPFLDNSLVDFAMRLPIKLKLANLKEVVRINENEPGKKNDAYFSRTKDGKLILRKVMERYIPREVTDREKQGFSAPDSSWFKGESIDFVNKVIENKTNMYQNYFDSTFLDELVDDHLSGRINRRLFVWSVLNLEILFRSLDADGYRE